MRLRVRSRAGVSNINVDATSTLADLYQIIAASASMLFILTHIPCILSHYIPTSYPPLTTNAVRFLLLVRSISVIAVHNARHKTVCIGFPPKPVTEPATTVLSTVLRDGDVIVAQPGASPPASATPSSNQPPATATTATLSTAAGVVPPTNTAVSAPSAPSSNAAANSLAAHGDVVMREVPDDNSCLFRSVNSLLGRPSRSPGFLRNVIARHVVSHRDKYTDAMLGRSTDEYAAWILSDNAWGGAIELSILAAHFQLQLAAFDVHTMRLDRYAETEAFPTVGFLIYDGIHYNYTALSLAGASKDADVTQFDASDMHVVEKVRQLAQHLHDTKSYTDTASFKLKCLQCNTLLKGEQQAVEHAKATGHSQFDES